MERSGDRPQILILAVHPPSVAATRLRALQYVPALEAAGFQVEIRTFLGEADLSDWFGPRTSRRVRAAIRGLSRIPASVRAVQRADVVLVQREAMPFGPPLLEWLAGRSAKLVWDLDDAVWVPHESPTAGRVPQWVRATGDKFHTICRLADEVWAGSEVLADWCRERNQRVRVIPTVVAVPTKRPAQPSGRIAGWIGSHSTVGFLEAVLPHLAHVSDLEVVVVGGAPRVPPQLQVQIAPWSEAEENRALSRMRVGLYPVDRAHPLADGKCGFKAILYMSRGIPPVVTPTPTNAAIVRAGIDGLHVDDVAGWASTVEALLDDPERCRQLGDAAHRRALEEFSLAKWAPMVVGTLRGLLP